MIRTLILCLLMAGTASAQTRLSDKMLTELEKTADRIALTRSGEVPGILLQGALALSGAPNEPRIAEQLASLNLDEAMRTLERRTALGVLTGMIEARMSPEDIARAYLATVYFGRNCFGYRDAAVGLARMRPERADDAIWLALLALPRSPSLYLGDRSALKARVELIIARMRDTGQIDDAGADRLKALRLANVDSGKGCKSY